jgi:serine/threonine-protein phosphatase 4 regulatory subunit 1
MIAQIIPNLIILYKPSQVRQFIWPIVKILLSDSVNIVRENVEWSIPIILQWYEPKNCNKETKDPVTASKFSSEACHEVFLFLKATLLDNTISSNQPTPAFGKVRSSGSFSKRQSYCRVLTAVALILRLNDKEKRRQRKKDPKDKVDFPPHAFYNLSSDQYRHVFHVLQELLLPSAIIMKDDKVTNVRLTLAKCLRVMPLEIRDEGEVCTVLSTLEDEIHTWEGGGGQYIDGSVPINPSSPGKRHTKNGTSVKSGAKMSPSKTSRQKSPATSPEIHEDDAQAAIERGQLRAEEEESSTMATI